VEAALEDAYSQALKIHFSGIAPSWGLRQRFEEALKVMARPTTKGRSGFSNLVTCLAIKAALSWVDIRKYSVKKMGAPFSFRVLSEKVVCPWLSNQDFDTAESGWQTRTYERTLPYTMDYPENIQFAKTEFLTCFDEVENHGESAANALRYIFVVQIQLREKKLIEIAQPTIDDIQVILALFSKHFFHKYTSKGAARLPVLALYAVYSELLIQMARFNGKRLKPLESHSAADARTGASADIEIIGSRGELFEAVEVKHGIPVTDLKLDDLAKKIAPFGADRFYWLTTSDYCHPEEATTQKLAQLRSTLGCQIIINGVLPTLRYYLRLLEHPRAIFPHYSKLLKTDKAIGHEHRKAWNEIVAGK